MKLIPPDDAARRARAAVAYAGLELPELENRTGIKQGTLRNILSKTRPQSGTVERLWAIADACQVPREFMEGGWSAITAIHHGSNNLSERMQSLSEELHERMSALERELAELAAAEVERVAGSPGTGAAGRPARPPVDPEQQGQQ